MSERIHLTERLVQILFKLVQRPHSRKELAVEFGVDSKTIKRNLDVLSLEFPITDEKRGREIFYKYADDFEFKVPAFSAEEVAVLLLAQKSISGIGLLAKDSFYAKTGETALRKIRKGLPNSVRKKIEALSKVYGSAQIPEKDFSEHTEIIENLTSCAVRQKKIEIEYHGLNSNKVTKRKLHPLAVYLDPDGATIKLVAFDPKHRDKRVFSIDRIAKFRELNEKFRNFEKFDLEEYIAKHSFNGIYGKPIKVTLKAKGITARVFRERQFHPTQKIIKTDGKNSNTEETIIEMHVAEGRGLERFILSYLPEIEVVKPKSLQKKINKILRASLPKTENKKLSAKI